VGPSQTPKWLGAKMGDENWSKMGLPVKQQTKRHKILFQHSARVMFLVQLYNTVHLHSTRFDLTTERNVIRNSSVLGNFAARWEQHLICRYKETLFDLPVLGARYVLRLHKSKDKM